MYYRRLYVIKRVVNQRAPLVNNFACLIFTVKLVNILNELSVEQMERNVGRTYARALATVGATTGNVERSDNMEHTFLKAVCSTLVFNAGIEVNL